MTSGLTSTLSTNPLTIMIHQPAQPVQAVTAPVLNPGTNLVVENGVLKYKCPDDSQKLTAFSVGNELYTWVHKLSLNTEKNQATARLYLSRGRVISLMCRESVPGTVG